MHGHMELPILERGQRRLVRIDEGHVYIDEGHVYIEPDFLKIALI